jgi:hypothetical protein
MDDELGPTPVSILGVGAAVLGRRGGGKMGIAFVRDAGSTVIPIEFGS